MILIFGGKNRNTLSAAIGEVQAQLADEAFTRLELGIAVAQTYFILQTQYKRLEILKSLVGVQEQYLSLVKKLVTGSLADVMIQHNAELNLTSARQTVIQLEGEIAVNEYQLKAYLAGNFEELIDNTYIIDQPLPKVPLPNDLPMHLIGNRPDITAQLWLIESAGKQIEVAEAGFYPDFNLSALYGYQTIHFRDWFKWPSSFYNVDPSFNLPIFDGGRLLANLRGSEVNYNLAIYQYNEMVLNAAKEVLDGIAVLRNAEAQENETNRYLEYQEKNFEITERRIKNHLSSGLDYLDGLQKVLEAQDQQTNARGKTIQAILSLIKALGGGYEVCIEE